MILQVTKRIANIRLMMEKGEEKMAKEKKLVEAITSMDEDFAPWYTDCLLYTSAAPAVKTFFILKPSLKINCGKSLTSSYHDLPLW